MNKSCLITGSHGFLGRNLKNFAINRGFRVIEVNWHDLDTDLLVVRNQTGDEYLIPKSGKKRLSEFLRSNAPDVVFHALARFVGTKSDMFLDNVIIGLNILDTVSHLDQKCYFFNFATAAKKDLNFYTKTKNIFVESVMPEFANCSSIVQSNLYLHNLYGKGASKRSFFGSIYHALKENVECIKLTGGEQNRDFVLVDDVISALDIVYNVMETTGGNIHGEIGTGKPISVRNFIQKVKFALGARTQLAFGALPYREGEVFEIEPNVDWLFDLGWRPSTNIIKNIEQFK